MAVCLELLSFLCVFIFGSILLFQPLVESQGHFDWFKYDKFDVINDQIRSVNAKNCRSKSRDQLILRSDSVSQLPVYNQLMTRVWYRNRTTLIHLHNMALNRAFFFSYVLQRMNDTARFNIQPNWMYYYFSTAADLFANPGLINVSSVYFDNNCHYPNWYTTVPFNQTLPLFAAKADRWNDDRDMENMLRETSGRACRTVDAGAGRTTNYTHSRYKMNPWYSNWLPDLSGALDSLTKFTYYVGIKYSNEKGRFTSDAFESFAFVGPSSPSASETDSRKLPVVFSPPYFDCGGSNKWVFTAVSPIVDFMPRYTNWTHLRRHRFIGITTVGTDFETIDFNACGVSDGNPGPSYLSGVARCRETTMCKHKSGYRFNRGGYTCFCKPGYSYPWWLDPPFQGNNVEEATREEYDEGFRCTRTQYEQVMPVINRLDGLDPKDLQKHMTSLAPDDLGTAGSRVSRRSADNGKFNDANETGQVWDNGTPRTSHMESPNAADGSDVRFASLVQTTKGSDVMKNTIPRDDYVEMNDVHVNVEKMYQEDLKEHRKLRDSLLGERKTLNFTLAKDVLLNNIIQLRDRHMDRFLAHRKKTSRGRRRHKRASVFDPHAFNRMQRILRQKGSVHAGNCHQLPAHQLRLPGDVNYGVWKQFAVEGRTALRLAHFLSLFLQQAQPEENFGNMKGGGRVHMDQMFGEVIANVMGNYKIYASGVFFDKSQFENSDGSARDLFGPWAYRQGKGDYFAIDRAGLPKAYVDEAWFHKMKSRFATNFRGTQEYTMRPYVRSDPKGSSRIKHEFFPLNYRAPSYQAGSWSTPFFRCDGKVDAWVMTYTAPFFGLDPLRTKLKFKGVVTVDVPLNLLHIHQCPQPFGVANAFKNTARCDFMSTNCEPLTEFPFTVGSYRCMCRVGFEYWHNDGKMWIEGAYMESEYEKKMAGLFSRFDLLRCRVSAASRVSLVGARSLVMALLGWMLFINYNIFR